MIYELREYYIAPGKAAALHRRFQEQTIKYFEKHGIKVIGYWDVLIGETPKLVYLCQYPDLGHRERAWKAFAADPGWQAAKAETERDGVLVERIVNQILAPTPYSPLQ